MKKKSQGELPLPSEEAPPSAPAPVWEITRWNLNEPSPHMSGAVVELEIQVSAKRIDVESALAAGKQRVDDELAKLEAAARRLPQYAAWRKSVEAHKERVSFSEEQAKTLKDAMDGALAASGSEEIAVALDRAAESERRGMLLKQTLETMRIDSEKHARETEAAITMLVQNRYQEILASQPLEENEVISALLSGSANSHKAVSFTVFKNYCGSGPWMMFRAKKICFTLLGKVPSSPDAEPAPLPNYPTVPPLFSSPYAAQKLYAQATAR
jgi:hypothetical protein